MSRRSRFAKIYHARCRLVSLWEDVVPHESPPLMIGPATRWSPDRTRLWIAVSMTALFVLALGGLYSFILMGAEVTRLLVWQSAIVAVGPIYANLITYYFPRPGEPAVCPCHAARQQSHVAQNQPDGGPGSRAVPFRRLAERAEGSITVAVIGSYLEHFNKLQVAAEAFRAAGLRVASPLSGEIINPGERFARLNVDSALATDAELQEQALERILTSDVVYVVAPRGCIGLTTSYELGHVVERSIPIFCSEPIVNIPVRMDQTAVRDAADLARELAINTPVRQTLNLF